MDKIIRVGARGSKLSIYQAKKVIEILEKKGFKAELITIKTKGDKVTDKPLFKIKEIGVFVKELENALLEKKIDIAIHSAKDVPTKINEELEITAYLKREEPNDILIGYYKKIEEIEKNAVIGTSSVRRREFLLDINPFIQIKDLRGNIDTRIEKWRNGFYNAIMLSYVSIKRLDIKVPFIILDIKDFPPSPGQGAICIEARRDFKFREVLREINDEKTEIEIETERKLLSKLGIGCALPFGCIAKMENGEIHLYAKYKIKENFKKVNVKGKTPEDTANKAYELLLR